MVLHVFVDDSDTPALPGHRQAYVLAGYLATPEAWASFSQEWEALLPTTYKNKTTGNHRFKMSEMKNRMDRVPPFYNVIVRHVLAAFSIVIYEDDLERAKSRIWSDNADLMFSPNDEGRNLIKKFLVDSLYKVMIDPSILRFSGQSTRISDTLAASRDRIEIYFDKDNGSPWLTEWWELFIGAQKADLEIYGTRPPQFVDDEEFLPVQAADFWAWWARRGYETGTFSSLVDGEFGTWKGPKGPPTLSMTLSEDEIATHFIDSFLQAIPMRSMANVYDANRNPRTERAMPVHRADKRSQMLSHFEKLLRRLRGG
jgi:Protein of unknown function (DUF3800)